MKLGKRFDMNKKPNKPRWYLKIIEFIGAPFYMWFNKGRVKVDKDVKKLKGPYLILATHASFMDFAQIVVGLMPRSTGWVMSVEEFRRGRFLMGGIGGMPKRKFTHDIVTTKHIMYYIKKLKHTCTIFPEARFEFAGVNEKIDGALGKLCKVLGVPLVMCISNGNFLNSPQWAKRPYKRVPQEAHIYQLCSQEEINTLSADQIQERIEKAFVKDEYKWQVEKGYHIKCKERAKGIHRILYKCPVCGEEFNMDSKVVGDQTAKFLELVYPSYLVNQEDVESLMDKDSTSRLAGMTFFRISSCTADNVDKVFENVNSRFEKLFTALYSIDVPVAYGVVSRDGVTNLVLGVCSSEDVEPVKAITQGMLSGIDIEEITPSFSSNSNKEMSHGILTGVPSLYVKDEKQSFSLSSIMRSLNGQNYSLLFVAKPVANSLIAQNISELISVRDKAFAVSKRNVARSSSFSETSTDTQNVNDTKNSVAGSVGGGGGAAVGAAAGALLGTFVFPGVGTAVGTAIGGAVGGGLGTIIGNIVGKGKSHSEGYSSSISKAITDGETVSGDI